MKKVIHRATERGHANHGWLDSYHTFSFAGFYNPAQMNFGALRVLNDDTVSGGMGFGKHPHDNMEIVSIPLEGALEHQDTMGNKTVIRKGEIQIMSAGTGIQHSEKNHSSADPVKFLQIWIFPEEKGITPRYDQQRFEAEERQNKFQTVVSPMDSLHEGVKIHQQSWFSLADLQKDKSLTYHIHKPGNGVYFFLLEGKTTIAGNELGQRDGIGISETDSINVQALEDSQLLVMEVPMYF